MSDFGHNVRYQRLLRHLTKEEFCGDESFLSIRQLSRIESGICSPSLEKVKFIAERLGVSIGDLTTQDFALPERYKALKFLLLRTQTFLDPERVALRQAYFAEIFENFYDDLPEDEQLVIEILHSKLQMASDDNEFSVSRILGDYLEQVKRKYRYNINDLILIDLYFSYMAYVDYRTVLYDKLVCDAFITRLLEQVDDFPIEDIFFLNKVFFPIVRYTIDVENLGQTWEILRMIEKLMENTQDFQRMPILKMLYWKYHLKCQDLAQADSCYREALLFAHVVHDDFLISQLEKQWEKDKTCA